MDKAYFETLSRYHRWAYGRLYDEVDRLPEGQYFASRKLFFDSIHGTLNHLLLVERLWMGRLTGNPVEFNGLDDELIKAAVPLRDAIFEQCDAWDDYIERLDASALEQDVEYRNTRGDVLAFPLGLLLAHVFNHATHHRGQISAALTQSGLPAPVMDIPYYLMEESSR